MTVRGLPGRLPEGEILLWQGAPDWRVLARTALRVRVLGVYFAALALLAAAAGRMGEALIVAGLGVLPVLLAYAYAGLVARASVYSITNRRVALRIGLALPVTLNLPLSRVTSVDLRTGANGSGDLSLTLDGGRFAYLVLWPHARPWRFSPAQPTMRGLADAQAPARVLADLLAGAAVRTEAEPRATQMPLVTPVDIPGQTPLAA